MKRIGAFLLLLLIFAGCLVPGLAERLSENQLASYYDGAVFVGDSITAQLLVYVREKQQKDPGFFSNVKFLTAQSYSLYTASRKNLLANKPNLKYRGEEMPLCRILKEMKPTKALILLGVNDYIGETIEKGIGYDERILDLTKEFAPDTQIIFQSLTPVRPAFCKRHDYRTLWDQYNAALEAFCQERNVPYIDIASRLKDEEGYLKKGYSSDGKYHLKPAGLQLWLDALLDYAQSQYDQGVWNPKEIVQ